MKDWTGNARSAHATLGARNYAQNEREVNDYYATEPKAVRLLLEKEKFSPTIWEPACGEGHLSKEIKEHGYNVYSSDLIDRGYGCGGIDFLEYSHPDLINCDIITNPPYKYAAEFVYKALELLRPGRKVAMFLKIQFLEGKARRKLFEEHPPQNYLCKLRQAALCARRRF